MSPEQKPQLYCMSCDAIVPDRSCRHMFITEISPQRSRMSEMVERVAKALCDFDLGKDAWDYTGEHECRDDYRALARVAIKEMREPTTAINKVSTMSISYGSDEIWREMIDAAMADIPGPEKVA